MQPLKQRALLAIIKAKRCFVIVTVIVDVAKVTVLTVQPNAEASAIFKLYASVEAVLHVDTMYFSVMCFALCSTVAYTCAMHYRHSDYGTMTAECQWLH
jgi:hypothetical protein